MIAWLLLRPKLAIALLLTLALAGWHYQDKFSDWLDARKITRLEGEVAALRSDLSAVQAELQAERNSAEAAKAARDRNDTEIPKARRESAGRVSRAATADLAQRVLDVQAAIEADQAADRAVRGTQPD